MAKKRNSGSNDDLNDGALNDDSGAEEKGADLDGVNDGMEELENPDSWELEEDLEE